MYAKFEKCVVYLSLVCRVSFFDIWIIPMHMHCAYALCHACPISIFMALFFHRQYMLQLKACHALHALPPCGIHFVQMGMHPVNMDGYVVYMFK
jgi:hypothetical protein